MRFKCNYAKDNREKRRKEDIGKSIGETYEEKRGTATGIISYQRD